MPTRVSPPAKNPPSANRMGGCWGAAAPTYITRPMIIVIVPWESQKTAPPPLPLSTATTMRRHSRARSSLALGPGIRERRGGTGTWDAGVGRWGGAPPTAGTDAATRGPQRQTHLTTQSGHATLVPPLLHPATSTSSSSVADQQYHTGDFDFFFEFVTVCVRPK